MQKEIDSLKSENEQLKAENALLKLKNEKLKRENKILNDIAEAQEKKTKSLQTDERNLEWENIAQTISHTMKGPNNIIVNKTHEIMNSDERLNLNEKLFDFLKVIETEARYSNDIIGLFDIIRRGGNFKTENIFLSDIIDMIKSAEERCIELAKFNKSELALINLERIAGKILNLKIYDEFPRLLNNDATEKLIKDKKYRIHRTAFRTVIDEFVLNMFRHAKSSKKPNDNLHTSDKPETFEVFFVQNQNSLTIAFRNSSRVPIYKSWDLLKNKDHRLSLPKKSFGLFLASLFDKDNPGSTNIGFYNLIFPVHENLSEIIISLEEV